MPEPEHALVWAATRGKPVELKQLLNDPDFRRHIGEAVERVNRNLSTVEKIRRFVMTDEPFWSPMK